MTFSALDFVRMVTSYGAKSERWPDGVRDSALEFATRHEGAAAVMEKEARLDAALDLVVAPPPSDLLKGRILRAAQTSKPYANDNRPGWGKIVAGLAACCLFGVFSFSLWQAQPANLPSDAQIIASIDIEGLSDEDIANFAQLSIPELETEEQSIDDIYGDLIDG